MFPSPAQRTFRDTFLWRVFAIVPFVILLGFGILDYSERHLFEPVLWGFTLFFFGLVVFAWVWAAKRRISLHQEGISYVSLTGDADLAWNEILETRYSQQPVNVGAHFGLIGMLIVYFFGKDNPANRSLKVIGSRTITISSNIRDVRELIKMVLERVNPRIRQEAERLLGSGGTVAFGNISLSPLGVIWKGAAPIPYNSIVKCRIDGSRLRIKAEGKWLDNIAVSPSRVPNVFVLIDLIESRRAATAPAPAMASSAGQYL
jgi:hypothetical protein